ncbi:MAG: hypothetical protein KUA37_08620 [Desulfomicrobium sp.]|uniref:c-type cytochrome domain-containing protein n=1 Tax=Hoeflea sp. TaxID=1940281 RepID=UPI0025C38DD6|nr:c-type cytochrome domain-containing protein [Hoeflea sp.]MBU4532005.1 hypothetical protein [Alphaproteobacteria bacterium]MBV1712052.1 hypothetical protein [Desulfomicrobium sp.]MBV1782222.1 hypothetical protein [Hoeflea sp.]
MILKQKLVAGAFTAFITLLSNGSNAQEWDVVDALFQERCVVCHSSESAPLGLQLDSHSGVLAGSENGPVVLLDAVEESLIIQRVTGKAEPRMPLDGPPYLMEDQITEIRAWIAAGAPGPDPEASEVIARVKPHDPYADGRVTYGEVAAIFGRHCIECHSDNSRYDQPPEGLRLDRYASVLAGGERLVLIPGNAQASEIIRRVDGFASPRMPFNGPPWLASEEVMLLRDWIDGGALSDEGVEAPVPVGGRVRMRGILTNLAEIDGAEFEITGSTRIDGPPGLGRAAEMRGRVDTSGRIIAERLRD